MSLIPYEVLNIIFSYIQSPTNEIMKTVIKQHYKNGNNFINCTKTLGHNANKLICYYLARKVIFAKIDLLGAEFLSVTNIIANLRELSKDNKNESNRILVKRNILTDFIKQKHQRRKRSGTIKAFLKSLKDYLQRKNKTN